MAVTLSATSQSGPQRFGQALLGVRNGSKLTQELLAEKSGVPLETIQQIEAGRTLPSLEVLQQLAQALTVNLRDLLPIIPDTTEGIKVLRKPDRYNRVIERGGKPYYLYADLVTTTENVGLRPEMITLLCAEERDVVMNKGHFLHQCTLALHGRIRFFWEFEGRRKSMDFQEGDSWYIRPYIPHSFMSLDKQDLATIIAFTFPGGITGDAVQELRVLGVRAAQRIVEDEQWYVG